MFKIAKISTISQTSKLFQIIVRIMSNFLYLCTYKASIEATAPIKGYIEKTSQNVRYLMISISAFVSQGFMIVMPQLKA